MKLGFMLPEVLRGFYRSVIQGKPDTVRYPFEKLELPKNFRGTIDYQQEKCIGCKMCVRDCPCDAIHIQKVGEKKFAWTYYIDRCCRCNQCVEVCPVDCLISTHNFESASGNLNDFIVQSPPLPPAPPAPPAPPTA